MTTDGSQLPGARDDVHGEAILYDQRGSKLRDGTSEETQAQPRYVYPYPQGGQAGQTQPKPHAATRGDGERYGPKLNIGMNDFRLTPISDSKAWIQRASEARPLC